MKYRIVCIDDPQEETIHFDNQSELLGMIREWFCAMTKDGYYSIRQFNSQRAGMHCIQVHRKGRWVKAK